MNHPFTSYVVRLVRGDGQEETQILQASGPRDAEMLMLASTHLSLVGQAITVFVDGKRLSENTSA